MKKGILAPLGARAAWRRLIFCAVPLAVGAQGMEPCKIVVTEKGSGWPVPLVELRTTHQVRLVTDNAGVIAFDLPEMMGRETWFDVAGHGYGVGRDGFGMRGVRLVPEPGRTLAVEVERAIIAKRLGRLTGGGIFAESQKLGLERAWRESGAFGCDSVQCAVYNRRLFWLWGDTTLARYPLGIFHSTGAETAAWPFGAAEPPLRVRFDVFADAGGGARGIAKLPGDGPTWLSGLVSVNDRTGAERLCAVYAKIKPPLEAYEKGLCVWNGFEFERLKKVWEKSESAPEPPPLPEGHAVAWGSGQGTNSLWFGDPFPRLRCPATFEAWQDPAAWVRLEPQKELAAAADGAVVKPHSGSIAWNGYRKKWVTVFMQAFGKPSVFGEVWYAEAAAPTGPWGKAVKVLSHDNYTFYNPRLHPECASADSPVLLFEGSYTAQFADKPAPTPRYDYTQVLYRLDLDDPALAPARQVLSDSSTL
jgi:hypothetical protein